MKERKKERKEERERKKQKKKKKKSTDDKDTKNYLWGRCVKQKLLTTPYSTYIHILFVSSRSVSDAARFLRGLNSTVL